MKIELRILDERLHAWGLPTYHSEQAAAVDLHACIDQAIELQAGDKATLIPVGFALHMGDAAMAALIMPRSGLGHKKGLVLGNGIGLIDPDFTGAVMVSAWNRHATGDSIAIAPGDRIAQMTFVPVLRPTMVVVAEFTATSKRGTRGFGSTG